MRCAAIRVKTRVLVAAKPRSVHDGITWKVALSCHFQAAQRSVLRAPFNRAVGGAPSTSPQGICTMAVHRIHRGRLRELSSDAEYPLWRRIQQRRRAVRCSGCWRTTFVCTERLLKKTRVRIILFVVPCSFAGRPSLCLIAFHQPRCS